jgi:hypothetical protein
MSTLRLTAHRAGVILKVAFHKRIWEVEFERLQRKSLTVIAVGNSNLANIGMGDRRYTLHGADDDVKYWDGFQCDNPQCKECRE